MRNSQPDSASNSGFRPRNERVAVHGDFESAKRGRAGDVLQRFALAAAFDEFAQRVRFRRGEHALEIQIQLHARQLEQMREQEFGLQARRFNAFFGEKFRALLNRFENGHADSLNPDGVIKQAERATEFSDFTMRIFRISSVDQPVAKRFVKFVSFVFPDDVLEVRLAFPLQPHPANPGANARSRRRTNHNATQQVAVKCHAAQKHTGEDAKQCSQTADDPGNDHNKLRLAF